jgi:glycosyltransferase involved in cell wall biosynthesis
MGGGEIRVERTRRALEAIGIEADYYNPNDREISGHLVHFFGTLDYYWYVAAFCIERKIPYICSPIFMGKNNKALARRSLRSRMFDKHHFRRLHSLYSNAARLVVLNQHEDERLRTYFHSGLAPTVAIPNGIDTCVPRNAELFRQRMGVEDPFVLHVGRFDPTKNQLGMIHALRDTGYRMVFIGRSQDSAYLEECRRRAPRDTVFLLNLAPDDPVLGGAYAASRVFCLPSVQEGMSNAVLEAGVSGAPIVTGDSWGADEFFGGWASTVRVTDTSALRSAVVSAWNSCHDPEAEREFFMRYSWPAIARQTQSLYNEVLQTVRYMA